MKLLIELPADQAALMLGLAEYHGQSLREWILTSLTSDLLADLEGAVVPRAE